MAATTAKPAIDTKTLAPEGHLRSDVAIQTPNADTTKDDDDDDLQNDSDDEQEEEDEKDFEFRYEDDSDYVDDDGQYLSSYDLLAGNLAGSPSSPGKRRAGGSNGGGGGRHHGRSGRESSYRARSKAVTAAAVAAAAARQPDDDRLRRRRVSFIKRRSISLDAILNNSLVHELPETGEQIIISRGWPAAKQRQLKLSPAAGRKSASSSPRSSRKGAHGNHHHHQQRHHSHLHNHRRPSSDPRRHQKISGDQKRRLLVEFLRQTSDRPTINQTATSKSKQADDAPAKTTGGKSPKRLVVEYDLAAHTGGPIELAEPSRPTT